MVFCLFCGDKKRVSELIEAARSGEQFKIAQLLT